MDDQEFGNRDKRGNWSPDTPIEVGPLLIFPWNPLRILKWLPSYIFPWNLFFMAVATLFWFYLTPSRGSLQTFGIGWIAFIFLRNCAVILLVFGALEFHLYLRRAQGNRFKYNGRFPADESSEVFMFKNQNIDNIIRTFASGLPVWTAYEVILLWCWANEFGPWMIFSSNPVWLIIFALVLPLLHELHFYCVHRLIHYPPVYKRVHSVHHNSVNPSPWSSLSMHPVEHLLYWSGALFHLVLPSHPLLALYYLQISGTGAAIGHVGFDKIEIRMENAVETHAYAHYLHHKYFEVNYSDGMLPIDKWMGTWHDGTKQAQQQMLERFKKSKSSPST